MGWNWALFFCHEALLHPRPARPSPPRSGSGPPGRQATGARAPPGSCGGGALRRQRQRGGRVASGGCSAA
eukprot:15190384-Alexandrium_andersonii.AAC.1